MDFFFFFFQLIRELIAMVAQVEHKMLNIKNLIKELKDCSLLSIDDENDVDGDKEETKVCEWLLWLSTDFFLDFFD